MDTAVDALSTEEYLLQSGGYYAKGKPSLGLESGAGCWLGGAGLGWRDPRQRGQVRHSAGPCVALLLAKTLGLLLLPA